MPLVSRIWSPNTCNCSFVVNLNTDLPDNLIDFIFVSVIRDDGLHGPLAGAALLIAAHNDNKLMNDVLREAEKIQPALLHDNYLFDFDVSRVLRVSFVFSEDIKTGPGVILNSSEKSSLRTEVDARFGVGRVVIT